MQGEGRVYSLPRWRVARWLVDAGPGVPDDIRVALVGGLFGTLPIFAAGVINTVVVAAAITARLPTAPFIAWLILEIAICTARLIVLIVARRAALEHRKTPTDIHLLLAVAWSASVGYGVLVSMTSGDWIAATVACTSAAAMVGGTCFRNFGAPQLAGTMILTSLGPCLPGAALAGEPLVYVAFVQAPLYLVAMTAAAFKLNKMLVATMQAGRENDHRARHDALTGLSNRVELLDAIDARLKAAPHSEHALALLFLDLDGFKTVNDTYGHAAGDRLLKMVADRLRCVLPATDVAARIGGDEFVVLAADLSHEQAMDLGQQLITTVATSYDLGGGMSAAIGVSVGIAMAPEHGGNLADLLAVADAALYQAKSSGKLRCRMASTMADPAALRRPQGERTVAVQIGVAA